MSVRSRQLLANLFALLAVVSVVAGISQNRWGPGCIAAAACLLVALICAVPRSRPVTVRLLGCIFLYVCAVIILNYFNSPAKAGELPVAPIFAGFMFGLPGGYMACTGRDPSWGKFGEIMNRDRTRDRDRW